MSYPQLLPDSDPSKDYVTFSVPNQRIVRKIEHDSDNEDHLRIQVLSGTLIRRVEELAHLFSKYNVEAEPIDNRYEILVKLFVPSLPPCSPPPPPPLTIPSEVSFIFRSPKECRRSEEGEEEEDGMNMIKTFEDVDGETSYESEPRTWHELNRMKDILAHRPRLSTIDEEEEEKESEERLLIQLS